MTRFATLFILASLLAMGCNKTPSEAQEQQPAAAQPPVTANQQAQLREKAGDSGAQPTQPAPVAERNLQKKIEPLIKEAQSGGNAEEIRPKAMKIRKEHEDKIEALLTDAQKKQWKEMLGKPLFLDD